MSKAITEDRAQKRGIRVDRLRDQLKGDLEAIVSNSLTANPKDRYRNVSDLMIGSAFSATAPSWPSVKRRSASSKRI